MPSLSYCFWKKIVPVRVEQAFFKYKSLAPVAGFEPGFQEQIRELLGLSHNASRSAPMLGLESVF